MRRAIAQGGLGRKPSFAAVSRSALRWPDDQPGELTCDRSPHYRRAPRNRKGDGPCREPPPKQSAVDPGIDGADDQGDKAAHACGQNAGINDLPPHSLGLFSLRVVLAE
nr:hypothetical protein [Hyphomonas sp. L-53-1-40]